MTTELTKAAKQALMALRRAVPKDSEQAHEQLLAVQALNTALTQRPAAQATPEQNAEAAGLLSATGHLSTLLNESTQMLAQLRALVDALHNQWSNGGAPERGEYPLLDRVDDWLGARPSEMVSPKQATPEPEQWRKRRMANVPHPHDQESRIIGFVVPKDDAPIGMVTEQLAAIIGANATPEPLNEQDAVLLNQAHEILLEHAEDQRHKWNDSQAMGATCSADAVLRLSAQAFARQRATPPQQAAGEPVGEVVYIAKGHLREVLNGNTMTAYLSSEPDRFADVALFAHPAPGVPEAWDEGYKQGVEDERTSEANIGIAGFGAKVSPARQNPYRAAQAKGGEQ